MRSLSRAPAAASPSLPGLQPGFVSSSSCRLGWPWSSFLSLFLLVILFIVSALSRGSEGILLNGLSLHWRLQYNQYMLFILSGD